MNWEQLMQKHGRELSAFMAAHLRDGITWTEAMKAAQSQKWFGEYKKLLNRQIVEAEKLSDEIDKQKVLNKKVHTIIEESQNLSDEAEGKKPDTRTYEEKVRDKYNESVDRNNAKNKEVEEEIERKKREKKAIEDALEKLFKRQKKL